MKHQGRLIAMAGERLRVGEWAEVSGVCVHPDARGNGLARLLSTHVAGRMFERDERPFLHCYDTNEPAKSLYRSLGFETRDLVNVTVAMLN